MGVLQISVFIESKPGYIKQALDALAAAPVSIRGYCASDTGDFGIVRFVVDDTQRGLDALLGAGFAAKTKEVLVVELADDPGELGRVLGVMAGGGLNVSYSYSLAGTYIAIQVEDMEAASRLLADEGFALVEGNDQLS